MKAVGEREYCRRFESDVCLCDVLLCPQPMRVNIGMRKFVFDLVVHTICDCHVTTAHSDGWHSRNHILHRPPPPYALTSRCTTE